jgi:asparagine synthase (glutamine-hydrolysing)
VMRSYGLRALPAVAAAMRRHGEGGSITRLVATHAASALLPGFARRAYRRSRRLRALPADARLLRPEVARRHFADRWVDRPAGRAATEQEHHASRFLLGSISFPHECVGQVAFAHGIEPRSPFSDRRMMEFAIGLPFEAKAATHWYKRLMREAGGSYLPEPVRWRTDITMHPGGQFRAEFIRRLARDAPGIWNREFVERTMKEWVDPAQLRVVWDRHQSTGALFDGFDLLVLVLSAQWLSARFGQGS